MRRRANELIPLEVSILVTALSLKRGGTNQFHGFLIAKEIATQTDRSMLTAHGTLYKALSRLEQRGMLNSSWEDPASAALENRPRRRLYEITAEGHAAAAAAQANSGGRIPYSSRRRAAT